MRDADHLPIGRRRASGGGVPKAGLLFLVLLVSSCATAGTRKESLSWSWPPDEPRIALHGVLEPQTQGGWLRALIGERPEPLRRPFAVAFFAGGLAVADVADGSVQLVDAETGKRRERASERFLNPVGLAACGQELLVVDSAAGRVVSLDGGLRLGRVVAEELDRPTAAVCTPRGVAISETGRHRILLLAEDGARETLGKRGKAPGEFNFPTALAAKGASLWVADTLNFRIQEIDLASRQAVAAFGVLGDSAGSLPRTKGIGLDAVGQLWVSDVHLDQVALFDRQGRLLLAFGGSGVGGGRFQFPAGVATHPDGRVAIADSLNARVQVFELLDPRRPV